MIATGNRQTHHVILKCPVSLSHFLIHFMFQDNIFLCLILPSSQPISEQTFPALVPSADERTLFLCGLTWPYLTTASLNLWYQVERGLYGHTNLCSISFSCRKMPSDNILLSLLIHTQQPPQSWCCQLHNMCFPRDSKNSWLPISTQWSYVYFLFLFEVFFGDTTPD